MEDVCEKIKVHQGLNIRRIRTASQLKQETLAQRIGVAQQTMSKYENQEVVDNEVLSKCAEALKVPVELLKNMPATEDAPVQYFKDVNFTNSAMNGYVMGGSTSTQNLYYSEKVILKALQEEVERLKRENEEIKSGQSKK